MMNRATGTLKSSKDIKEGVAYRLKSLQKAFAFFNSLF